MVEGAFLLLNQQRRNTEWQITGITANTLAHNFRKCLLMFKILYQWTQQ